MIKLMDWLIFHENLDGNIYGVGYFISTRIPPKVYKFPDMLADFNYGYGFCDDILT